MGETNPQSVGYYWSTREGARLDAPYLEAILLKWFFDARGYLSEKILRAVRVTRGSNLSRAMQWVDVEPPPVLFEVVAAVTDKK